MDNRDSEWYPGRPPSSHLNPRKAVEDQRPRKGGYGPTAPDPSRSYDGTSVPSQATNHPIAHNEYSAGYSYPYTPGPSVSSSKSAHRSHRSTAQGSPAQTAPLHPAQVAPSHPAQATPSHPGVLRLRSSAPSSGNAQSQVIRRNENHEYGSSQNHEHLPSQNGEMTTTHNQPTPPAPSFQQSQQTNAALNRANASNGTPHPDQHDQNSASSKAHTPVPIQPARPSRKKVSRKVSLCEHGFLNDGT